MADQQTPIGGSLRERPLLGLADVPIIPVKGDGHMIWDANETAARYGLEHIARLIYFAHLAPDDTERRRAEVGRLIDLHDVDSVIKAARELIAQYRVLQADAAEIASRG